MLAVAATTGTMSLTSCESELDIERQSATGISDFYKTDKDAQAALVAAYDGFLNNVTGRQSDNGGPGIYTPYKIVTNMCGDDVLAASSNAEDHTFSIFLNEFTYDPTAEAVRNMYNGLYLSIYTCNLLIDNFDEPKTPVQKRCVAEARVMRAYDFFMLACLWGTPPFVDHVLTKDAKPFNCDVDPVKPMSHDELILWVAKECEEALPDLTERKDKSDKNGAVIVTKGFANALAGKAYLFAGKYNEAKVALKKVIDSDKYALVPGDRYLDNFHIEGDCNEEKVFELNFESNEGKSTWGGMIQRSSWMEANAWNWRAGCFAMNPAKVYCGGEDGWGGLGVPQWFGDEFFANDGHSKRFDATLINIDDAVYGMKYSNVVLKLDDAQKSYPELESYWTVSTEKASDGTETKSVTIDLANVPMDVLQKSKIVGIKDPVDGLYGNSFWLAFKQLLRDADTEGKVYGGNVRLNNYIVMRYAEVLLNYAEACIQTGDAATAKTYINMIQERAGSKTISSTVDMEVLKKEKAYELWTEGCRWMDIMRWKDSKAITRLKTQGSDIPHLFDKLYRMPKADDRNVIWENGTEANSRFYTVSSSYAKDNGAEVGFKENKHELLSLIHI